MAANNYFRFPVFIFFAFVFANTSHAQTDQDKPVTVEADSAQLDDQGGVSVYSGSVSITQDSLHITADKVTAHHKSGGINKIVAVGNPARYKQADGAKGGIVHASANTINYLTDENKVVLTGNASLEQQGNTVQGQSITYDMKRKIGSAGSPTKTGQQEGRVKMVFQPKSSNTPKQPADAKTP